MLEQEGLWIGPWTEAYDDKPSPRRPILDRFSRRPLGFACRRTPTKSWFPFLSRKALDVYETEDASLLMTIWLPRFWSRSFEVCDAEGRHVGLVFRRHLLDWENRRLAWTLRNPGKNQGIFLSPVNHPQASFEIQNGGACELHFEGASAGNPFLRMMLVGAVLSWD